MSQQDLSSRIFAGALTIVGLGAVWIAILTSLPSREELSPQEAPPTAHAAAGTSVSSLPVHTETPSDTVSAGEPTLDLSIPGAAPLAPPSEQDQSGNFNSVQHDSRLAQVTRLKCEAEIEQLCPDAPEGSGRARCLERRAKDLPLPCQNQLRERFVKWKEDRSRMLSACASDVRRLCVAMKPGEGRVMHCLQEHAQEVSDGCYQTLPKGTLLFRQQ
ncbi:MAG TPA: cysteine rich repeat-containing protein, partial [Nitrospira sp.]